MHYKNVFFRFLAIIAAEERYIRHNVGIFTFIEKLGKKLVIDSYCIVWDDVFL